MKLTKSRLIGAALVAVVAVGVALPAAAQDDSTALYTQCAETTLIGERLPGGGVEFAVFPAVDANGQPVITVYSIDANGNGDCAIYLTKAEADRLPDIPNDPILVTENKGVALYKLPTGEFQVNSTPDNEYKVEVVNFDDVTVTRTHYHNFYLPG